MSNVSFDRIDLFLVDSDLNARLGCKNILYNNGFRDVRLGDSLANLRHVLSESMPDVLLCSATLPDGDFCEFVHSLRHNKVGNNPFLPVIALVQEPTPEMVTKIMDAGTDDVVTKPISTSQLIDRINGLISSRKPFVVTETYVGPARRGDDLSKAVEVPNTLRSKAKGEKVGFHDIELGIDAALTEVSSRKIEAAQETHNRQLKGIGIEIAALVGKLVPLLERNTVNETTLGGLNTLIDTANDACARLEGSQYAHVSELCAAIVRVSSAICEAEGTAPDPKDVKLLKPLSQAVQAGFAGGINSAAAARAIVEQIVSR